MRKKLEVQKQKKRVSRMARLLKETYRETVRIRAKLDIIYIMIDKMSKEKKLEENEL